jgi:hypothetical protein
VIVVAVVSEGQLFMTKILRLRSFVYKFGVTDGPLSVILINLLNISGRF